MSKQTPEGTFEEHSDFKSIYDEARNLMTEHLLPPEEYGESFEAERLYAIINESERRFVSMHEESERVKHLITSHYGGGFTDADQAVAALTAEVERLKAESELRESTNKL